MLQIKSVTDKTIYDVVIEYDNNDGKGVQTVSTQVEKLPNGNFSSVSFEDDYVIKGTYQSEERFSNAVNAFLNSK